MIWSGKVFKNCKTLRIDTAHFVVMTRNAKMVAVGTFEPCEKGTNDQRLKGPLVYSLMSPACTCLLSKLVNAKKRLFIKKVSISR